MDDGNGRQRADSPEVIERAGERDAGDELLELLAGQAPQPAARLDGLVIGVRAVFDVGGAPVGAYPGAPDDAPIAARSLAALDAEAEGREVALMFEGGDPRRPIVLGLIQDPTAIEVETARGPIEEEPETPANAEIDGERIALTAKNEIVLRCGKASITLTRAGKILIRGAYLSSRSSGVNRIKGGSVQIN